LGQGEIRGIVMEEELFLEDILALYRGERRELIPILHEIQDSFGYLPERVMLDVARFLGLSESHVYSVASFYTQFRLLPLGKKRITICRGTACHIRGAPQILNEIEGIIGIKDGETTPDLEYTLETVACIGCCALAPCIKINNDVYGDMNTEKVKENFSFLNQGENGAG
jgi:NADH-quinone oxidoreductase subunit E